MDVSAVDVGERTQNVESNYFVVGKAEVFKQSKPAFVFTENCEPTSNLDSSTTVVIGQGAGNVTEVEEKKLHSENFATCIGLVLINTKTNMVALFHIDANYPKGIDQRVLNKISEGGGLVVMQAIRGSQSIPSEETKNFFAEHISINTVMAEDILINTGSAFWSITTNGSELEIDVGERGQKLELKKENLTNIPGTEIKTDQLKIDASILKDKNIDNYLKGFKEMTVEEILDQLNYLATFVSKERSEWISRWVLSSEEEKKSMSGLILRTVKNVE